MHVEVDDRGAGDAVMILRIARGNGGVVEQAKAHRACGLGMMAGRPRGDKGIGGFLGEHLVDGMDGAADGAERRLKTSRRYRGVGIDPDHACARRGVANLHDVVHRMAQGDHFERRRGRFDPRQRLKPFRLERLLDGAQPVRPLRMAERRQVLQAGGMGDQQRGHRRRRAGR